MLSCWECPCGYSSQTYLLRHLLAYHLLTIAYFAPSMVGSIPLLRIHARQGDIDVMEGLAYLLELLIMVL